VIWNLGSKISRPCHAVICFKHNVQMLKSEQETACQVSLPLLFGEDLGSEYVLRPTDRLIPHRISCTSNMYYHPAFPHYIQKPQGCKLQNSQYLLFEKRQVCL
jgi:hypothetical protein